MKVDDRPVKSSNLQQQSVELPEGNDADDDEGNRHYLALLFPLPASNSYRPYQIIANSEINGVVSTNS